jgi:hypothetical protein
MKSFFLLLSLVFIAVNSRAVEIKSSNTSANGLSTQTVRNKFLTFTVIPDANGRISSLILNDNKKDILLNYEEKRKQEDPLLPEMIFSNNGGYKEWFWQKKWRNIPNSKLSVTNSKADQEQACISLFSKGYMSSPVQMSKTYTLKANSLQIGIDITLKNCGKQNVKFALWINILPTTDKNFDYTILPIAGNSPMAQKRPTLTAAQDEIKSFKSSEKADAFIAPGASWNARFLKKANALMVVRTSKIVDLRPGGMFYAWSGRINGQEVITQEVIFAPLELAPSQQHNYKVKLMIFPGISEVNTICDDTAIYAEKKNKKIFLTLNSTVPKPVRILKICWENGCREIKIPAMSPGNNIKITVELPGNNKKRLKYYLGKNKINILPLKK